MKNALGAAEDGVGVEVDVDVDVDGGRATV